jgi:zinc transport system substrate-binding protein
VSIPKFLPRRRRAGSVALCLAALLTSASVAAADVPRVVADIGPVQALVDRVMAGVGHAEVLLPAGASPHGYAMRPSEARALAGADVVVWTGPALAPWVERGLDSLAGNAARLALLDLPGTVLHEARGVEGFDIGDGDGHDHDHDHETAAEHDDDHDHDHETANAAEHDHDHNHETANAAESDHDHDHDHETAKAGDHDAAEAHDHDHAHDGPDPHAWLDPRNGALWMGAIAEALAAADPANAAAYRANAAAGQQELAALEAELTAALAPMSDRRFIVFHDSLRYFEERFGVTAAGAIALSDAAPPSAAHLSALRARAAEADVACIFAEPQFPAGLVETVAEGTALTVAVVDPLGSDVPPGPEAYAALLRGLAGTIGGCLGATG